MFKLNTAILYAKIIIFIQIIYNYLNIIVFLYYNISRGKYTHVFFMGSLVCLIFKERIWYEV